MPKLNPTAAPAESPQKTTLSATSSIQGREKDFLTPPETCVASGFEIPAETALPLMLRNALLRRGCGQNQIEHLVRYRDFRPCLKKNTVFLLQEALNYWPILIEQLTPEQILRICCAANDKETIAVLADCAPRLYAQDLGFCGSDVLIIVDRTQGSKKLELITQLVEKFRVLPHTCRKLACKTSLAELKTMLECSDVVAFSNRYDQKIMGAQAVKQAAPVSLSPSSSTIVVSSFSLTQACEKDFSMPAETHIASGSKIPAGTTLASSAAKLTAYSEGLSSSMISSAISKVPIETARQQNLAMGASTSSLMEAGTKLAQERSVDPGNHHKGITSHSTPPLFWSLPVQLIAPQQPPMGRLFVPPPVSTPVLLRPRISRSLLLRKRSIWDDPSLVEDPIALKMPWTNNR